MPRVPGSWADQGLLTIGSLKEQPGRKGRPGLGSELMAAALASSDAVSIATARCASVRMLTKQKAHAH